jgi:diaminopimelate dehydrogenase
MEAEGKWGCYTVFDVPPAYLSPLSGEELRRTIL